MASSDLYQPTKFGNGLFGIVHLEPQYHIVVQPHAAVFFDDEHRGTLHTSAIPSRGLTCFERRHEPQRKVPLRRLKRLDHGVHDIFAREDVALSGDVPTSPMPRPL